MELLDAETSVANYIFLQSSSYPEATDTKFDSTVVIWVCSLSHLILVN